MADVSVEDVEVLIQKYVIPEPNCGCWLWVGPANTKGYGQAHIYGKRVMAHRMIYKAFKRTIPDGFQLDHLCRVPSCVNPDHLEAVTPRENTRRGLAGHKNKKKEHCPRGHTYTDKNTKIQTRNGVDSRICRKCQSIYGQKWYRKNRESILLKQRQECDETLHLPPLKEQGEQADG